MSTIKILVKRLIANYSSSCNFKIKIVANSSPDKESTENKHSFKYAKGSSEVIINEKLDLVLNQTISSELNLHFFLEVYTKTGYKTAGVGKYTISNSLPTSGPIQISIQKCPLGDGTLEVQFENNNYNASAKNQENYNVPSSSKINMNMNQPTNSQIYSNMNKPISNSTINNANNEIIKEKDQQINELKTKIDYYEQENNELKGLINDFKKEKRKYTEEKNSQISQQKEQIQKLMNEKDDIQMELMSLKQNMNLLQNNKMDTEQKVLNLKNQTDKQIKDLMQQIKNLNNIKFQLENDNKTKEEKIINLEMKNKEMSINYKKKLNELGNNYSSEKNNVLLNHTEQLKSKEEEIVKLNIKIRSLEENIQSLNDVIEATKKENKNNNSNGVTENMTKLLDQISEKDKKIFKLQKELNELNNKINNDMDNKDTQNMINSITEKDLKENINELQNIINEKDNELTELRNKYDTLKYESSKFHKVDYNGGDEEYNEGNNEMFINQLKEIQKTYKEREEKLINEKNEEIRKLKMKNKDLVRESVLDNNSNIDINKYINEINRLKNLNNTLEEDLGYYKELNSRFVDNEKKSTVYESENVKLKNELKEKKDVIDALLKKQKELIEQNNLLEQQLVTSKGKLGEVLNELAEAESKCVTLEEEKKKMKQNMGGVANGGGVVNIIGKIGKIAGKKDKK